MAAGAVAELQLPAAPGYIYPHVARSVGGVSESAVLAGITKMSIAWDASKRAPGLQALLEALETDKTQIQWSEADYERWMERTRRNSPSVRADHLRHLRFMASFPAQPVTLHGTRWQFAVSALLYLEVRETVKLNDDYQADEEKGKVASPAALIKDQKVLRKLGGFLGIAKDVWPTQPLQPQTVKEVMPTPEQVRELLTARWTSDPKHAGALEDAWVRHVLTMMFGLGPRPPKELWVMEEAAWMTDKGILKIVEPKKRYRERLVFVEPRWLARSPRHPSLDNWTQVWLPKLKAATGSTSTRMFPNPLTGKDFPSPEAFSAFLHGRVQQRFPWFHNYLARHWSVYARLIGDDGDLSDTRYNQVAEAHGHESVDLTRETYGPGARVYAKAYGVNWLSRAFGNMQAPPPPPTAGGS